MPIDWTIYAAGNGDFLWWVLRGVSMITGDGSWESMVAVGFFLGIIWVILKGLLDGAKEIEVQSIVSAWLLFAVFFGTTSTVQIEDSQTGALAKGGTPIEDVPLGVAAAGGIISTFGKTLTDLFEQVYTMPGQQDFMRIGEQGFSGTLETMMRLRGLEATAYKHDETGFMRSVKRYTAECTIEGMNIVNAPLERSEIRNAENVLDAMRFDSNVYWTTLYIGDHVTMPSTCVYKSSNEYDCSCADGHDALMDFQSSYSGSADMENVVNAASSLHGKVPGAMGVQNSIEAVLSSAADHNQYLMNRIVQGAMKDGEMMAAATSGDVAALTMLETARAQRDAAWVLEDSMFRQIVVPLMTFLESAMYAVTPIVALMIVLGSAGFSMLVKYLGFIGWTQLWLPILAIINFYAQWAVSRAVSDTLGAMGGTMSPVSLNGIGIIEAELQHWLGVAGMLGAATPVITLMLITGSTMAATRLTGQFESTAGGVAENQVGSAVNVGAGEASRGSHGLQQGEFGWTHGYNQTGDAKMGALTLGASAAQQSHQMEAAAASMEQSYSQSVSNSIAENQEFKDSWSSVSSSGETTSHGLGTSDQLAMQHAESIGKEEGWNDKEMRTFAASISGSAGVPEISPLAVGTQLEAKSSENFEASESVKSALQESVTESGTLTDEFKDVRESSEKESAETSATTSAVDSAKEEYAEKLQMAEAYREESQDLEKWGNEYGVNREYEMAEAKTQIANDSGTAEKYRDWQSERLENLGRNDEAAAVQMMDGNQLADHFAQTANAGPAAGESATQFYQGLAHTVDEQGYDEHPYAGDGFQEMPTPPSLDDEAFTSDDGTTANDIGSQATGPNVSQGDATAKQERRAEEIGDDPAAGGPEDHSGERENQTRQNMYLGFMNYTGEDGGFNPGQQAAAEGQDMGEEAAQEARAAEMERNAASSVYDVADQYIPESVNAAFGTNDTDAPGINQNPDSTSDSVGNAITGTGNLVTGGMYGEAVDKISDAKEAIAGWWNGDDSAEQGGEAPAAAPAGGGADNGAPTEQGGGAGEAPAAEQGGEAPAAAPAGGGADNGAPTEQGDGAGEAPAAEQGGDAPAAAPAGGGADNGAPTEQGGGAGEAPAAEQGGDAPTTAPPGGDSDNGAPTEQGGGAYQDESDDAPDAEGRIKR